MSGGNPMKHATFIIIVVPLLYAIKTTENKVSVCYSRFPGIGHRYHEKTLK